MDPIKEGTSKLIQEMVVEKGLSKTMLGKFFGATFLTTLITSMVFEHGPDMVKFIFNTITYPFRMFKKKKEENPLKTRLDGVEKRLNVLEGRIPQIMDQLNQVEKIGSLSDSSGKSGSLHKVPHITQASNGSRAQLRV